MRGNPSVSTDIFKQLRGGTQTKNINPNIEYNNISMGNMQDGGAFSTLKNKLNEGKEITKPSAGIKSISIDSIITEGLMNIKQADVSKEYSSAFRSVVNLYLLGESDKIRVYGISEDTKNELLSMIEELKRSVEKSM